MGDPLIDATDLATYLNDPSIDQDRATLMIVRAQTLCESVLSPLPDTAAGIVERIAGRGYVSAVGGRGKQVTSAGSPFGAVPGAGAIYLTRYDKADLRRLAGGGGAFSIDLLPSDYVTPCGTVDIGDFTVIDEINR